MESTPMHEPRVLFERSGVIALAKPPGLATQAPPGIDSVERWLRGRLAPGAYLGIPHRLDRAVSGVLLMAATPRAARQLSRQFERRLVAKHYLAIVECRGDLPPSAAGAEWHDQVVKVPDEARARLANAAEGKLALTVARTLAADVPAAGRAILGLEPRTGRMHQLRLQAAARGLPIVGDRLYDPAADTDWSGPAAEAGIEPPIALHAWRIGFRDPDTGADVVAEVPLPDSWPAPARAAVS
jgi:23S rRNA pseudouridine1911/1915/1917 synthase